MIGPDDLPSVNAVLNTLSALLVLLGYVAIKSRQVTLHKTCMLAAVAVSTLFLTSYVYYHFVVRGGAATEFTGEGWMRLVYFTILVSHMVLAILVAPLVLITAFLGLRNRLDRHVRLARWTMPLWLYVSVTGVVVYWMLYRM